MASTLPSSVTTQSLIDYARVYDWCVPTVGLAGYSREPALSFSNLIIQKIMAVNNPWKWNSYTVPPIYTQPYQQDYPTSISANTMSWLESATYTDINNPAGTSTFFFQPPLQCVARLLPTSVLGVPTEASWLMNRNAQTGTWPGNNVTFQNPLVTQGGGPGSNPLTAITDPNGNIQVVTAYGTTVASGTPTWPSAGAAAGTITSDGTVQWTVQDPNGIAFRLNALATYNSNVWQLNFTYQQKAPLLTSLSQTFAPVPDDLKYLIEQGFLAYCYKKSDRATFKVEYAQWLEDIQIALGQSDREPQSFGIYPADPIQGGGSSGAGSHGYPGWLGWSGGGNI
jgi:hypothetical protein